MATKKETKKEVKLIHCGFCDEDKKSNNFFKSYNPLHTSGYLPYCKSCINDFCYSDNGEVNIEKLKELLMMVDRPFIYDLFVRSCDEAKNKTSIVGTYFKNIGLRQMRMLRWKDSIELSQENEESGRVDLENQHTNGLTTLTPKKRNELLLKWGLNYSDEELISFERKYDLLKNNYPEKTAMHTEALLTYIRYRVKEELSTANGDVAAAQKWGGLADKASERAKINPSQLSKADLTGGLNGFGDLSRAVEKAVDIIEILPRFKERPQDKVDFTLWCYINYVRRMKNLPDADYKDIWKFYEDRKEEYKKKDLNKEFEFEDEK